MARIRASISMSVDGFITGPNVDVDTTWTWSSTAPWT